MGKFSLAANFPQIDDAQWKALAEKALKGADFDKSLVSKTYDGLSLKPLYTRNDETSPNLAGAPGAAPFMRGFETRRSDPPWHIRQLNMASDPGRANAEILRDLEGGATAIELKIAAPGQNGTTVTSTADLEIALDGVALDLAGVWLDAGHNAVAAAQMLQDVWKNRGHSASQVEGGFGADPLGTLALTGWLNLSLEQAMADAAELAKTTHNTFERVTALRADARPYHGGGASEAEELACLCATVVAYLRALENGGLPPADALDQIELALAVDQDFFANISKLRAARALISRIADASGAGTCVSNMRLHAMTSFRMFARHDPQVNILRTTIACAAAALGGADAVTVLPYTLANGEPDRLSRRIARNIQIVLQEESSLGAVIDPAGGSWYAEDFTLKLAEKAWGLFQDIESQGGMAEALSKGVIQKMLAKTAGQRAQDIATGHSELTGVSSFPKLGDAEDAGSTIDSVTPLDDPAITVEPVPLRRPSEPFEKLRDAADEYTNTNDKRPAIALVTLGKASDHAARATYAESFFAAGGLETRTIEPGSYVAATAPVACICSSDDVYESEGADIIQALKKAGAKRVFSVGRPGALREGMRKAGVDEFLHRGCDMIEILNVTHDVLGLQKH